MQPFQVADPERIRAILEAFACLDDIRWSTMANYNLINFFRDDLAADERLLTHWLCYVTDRQMPFMRIWDVGGYVLSHLVRAYTQTRCGVRSLVESYVRRDGEKIGIECRLEGENAKLARYGITGPTVTFASRYMADDLVHIYRTLAILDSYGRSVSRFIAGILDDEGDHRHNIRRIAIALNALTYTAGGSFSSESFETGLDKMDQDAAAFEFEADADPELFGRKRLWCSLRDFLKSPQFNELFVTGLESVGFLTADRWKRTHPDLRRALDSLELPGDVWNNSEVFRQGLFSPYIRNERASWDMPQTIRRIYDILVEEKEVAFYPEQLDVTFDFVPRMCERSMCRVCLFGDGVTELCHQQPDYFCPVALVTCGYTHKCSPDTCGLKEDWVRGSCESPVCGM